MNRCRSFSERDTIHVWRSLLVAFATSLIAYPVAQAQAPQSGIIASGTPSPSNPLSSPNPDGVFVEVRTNNPNVSIDRVVEGGTVPVCVAPCRQALDRSATYVIQGVGIRGTSPFSLPDDRRQVTLEVRAGSTARFFVGTLLVGGGAASVFLGANLWSLWRSQPIPRGSGTAEWMMGIGIPAALLGLYLVLGSSTEVTTSTGNRFSKKTTAQRKRSWVALTPCGLAF